MQLQFIHKVVQFMLEFGGRATQDILADARVDEASKVQTSLPLQFSIFSLCSGSVHERKGREVVQVFRLGRIVSGGLARDLAYFVCKILFEGDKDFSEAMLAACCIENPYLICEQSSYF